MVCGQTSNLSKQSEINFYQCWADFNFIITREMQLGRKHGRSFASLANNIYNCSVSKVRTKCTLSAKCSCSTKWTLIWFFCRVRVHSLFSWWINNATMRILPFSGKGRICLFSDIHDPKGIRHQRPVNEKAFSGLQSLRSRIHLNQLGAKSFWHQVILQGETDNDH